MAEIKKLDDKSVEKAAGGFTFSDSGTEDCKYSIVPNQLGEKIKLQNKTIRYSKNFKAVPRGSKLVWAQVDSHEESPELCLFPGVSVVNENGDIFWNDLSLER
jgi:hypothetical protein